MDRKYSRQVILNQVGIHGQNKLKNSSVLIIGVGGLGCPVSLYLTLAGIGKIGLVDFDIIDITNIHRQPLYSEKDVGRFKVDVASEKLLAYNSNLSIELHKIPFDESFDDSIFSSYDLVLDCSDNFLTRYQINDKCVQLQKPFVSGSVDQFTGQVGVFNWNGSPCYRCLYPDLENSSIAGCTERGVIGITPGTIALLQSTEALKILLNSPNILAEKILFVDLMETNFKKLKYKSNPNCKCRNQNIVQKEIKSKPFLYEDIEANRVNDCLKISGAILLDVREPQELLDKPSNLTPMVHISLKELPEKYHLLDKNLEYLVACEGGVRSLQAIRVLTELGFAKLKNLKGGLRLYRIL